MKVISSDHHRNGVAGVGFSVYIVKDGKSKMLVVRFPKELDEHGILCAAFDLAKLAEGDIRFGSNSWRGDDYASTVDRYEATQEAKRNRAQVAA